MEVVTLSAPRLLTRHGLPAVAATIDAAGRRHELYVCSSLGPLADSADPFLAFALLPAMKLGADLRIEGAASPRLLRHVSQVQDIIVSWFPEYSRVAVSAARVSTAPAPTGGVGCFFSGGIDSSYTALKHKDEITHLIFVHGFDISTDNRERLQVVLPIVQQAARLLNKPLITVESNCREILDIYANWGLHSHGAALGGIALALAPLLNQVYIAGSLPYSDLTPIGSHPLLDPLWSTEGLEVVHDADQCNRWGKLAKLVDTGVALEWLRVCSVGRAGRANCCRCIKCLEVMACLEAHGALARSHTFPLPIDLGILAEADLDPRDAVFTETLLAVVEQNGTRSPLAQALRTRLRHGAWREGAQGEQAGDRAQTHMRDLEAQVQQAEVRVSKLRTRLNLLQSSRSWRLTAPLRRFSRAVQAWGRPAND